MSAQYTPKFRRWQAATAAVGYQPKPGQTISISYRYQRDTFDTIDAAFQAPISVNWFGVGRLNYSLQRNSTLNPGQDQGLVEGLIGAEYDGGCWVARLVLQQFAASASKKTSQLYLQIELNGIGRVGTDPLAALRSSIPNYRMINQLTPLPSRFENFQ
jgi:LPS-assembly protein